MRIPGCKPDILRRTQNPPAEAVSTGQWTYMDPDLQNHTSAATGDLTAGEEFGAVDIVSAFTALRHELKLQVRNGAETQQLLNRRLDRLEQLAREAAVLPGNIPDTEARHLALALVELEDALHRAVGGLQQAAATRPPNQRSAGAILRNEIAAAGRITRLTAGSLLKRLEELASEMDRIQSADADRIGLARQGLELLLERARRLMRERQIERRDVTGQAFDSSLMNALDAVSTRSVPPGHVAEQLKPAYLWRKQVLCFAEVRVARTI